MTFAEWPTLFSLAKNPQQKILSSEQTVVELGETTEPLGQVLPAGRIFVRKCYVDLFPVLWARFEKEKRVSLTITGTPGIGKSVFGLLFLIELVRFLKASGASHDKPVQLGPLGSRLSGHIIYEHSISIQGASTTFYDIDINAETISMSYEHPFCDSSYFLIKDGPCAATDPLCSVLWISSPRAGAFQKAREQGDGRGFILPPWDADELVECWRQRCAPQELFDVGSTAHSTLASEAMIEAAKALEETADEPTRHEAIIRRWAADLGPVARRVFNPSTAYNYLQTIVGALGNQDLDALARIAEGAYSEGSGGKFQNSHRLLLMAPTDDFTAYTFAPSSLAIGMKILHKQLASDLRSAYTLMGKMRGTPLALVFEPYAHFLMCKGGSFTIRDLHDNKLEELYLDPSEETIFVANTGLDELKIEDKKYYIPNDPTFAVVDAWCQTAMFQMTIDSSHPIKSGSVQFKALKGKAPNRIIFVVPLSIATDFKLQPLVTSTGDVRHEGPRGGWNDVKQFVLGVKTSV